MFECKCIYLLSRISSHLDDKGSRFLTGKENIFNLNPVPADVWFTQNSLEEVPRDPPPLLFPYCDASLWLIHFWEDLGLHFESLQKLQICKNSYIFCNIKLLSKKCAKPRSARIMINYSFLKALNTASSNMQKYLQSFQLLNF